MPEHLYSDQGRQFESKVIKAICKILYIRKTWTTPYHPQSDGQVEWLNWTLLAMLATCIEEHPFQWEEKLKKVCFAYNTSIHSTTGHTPFFLMFGRQARLPVDLLFDTPVPESEVKLPEYVNKLQQSLTSAYTGVRETMGVKQERQKEQYDAKVHGKPYADGDLVWLFNPALPRGHARKFRRPWIGPYRILEKLSEANYRIQHMSNGKRPVVHFDRLKPCYAGVHLPTHRSQQYEKEQQPIIPPIPVEQMDLLDIDDSSNLPLPPIARHYPQRLQQQPERLSAYLTH